MKHVGQTLSNTVRRCWTVFDQFWIVLDAGVFQPIQHHPTMLDFNTRHEIMAYFWSRERKCWTMLDEKFKQSQTSSNIVQHRPTLSNMFDCAVQTGQTCCVQQCLMFDQQVWSVWTGNFTCWILGIQNKYCNQHTIMLCNEWIKS